MRIEPGTRARHGAEAWGSAHEMTNQSMAYPTARPAVIGSSRAVDPAPIEAVALVAPTARTRLPTTMIAFHGELPPARSRVPPTRNAPLRACPTPMPGHSRRARP